MLGVDVLDHLFSSVALDVDVDVRRAVPLRRQEALEQQAERHRVGRGDPERVADGRVRRRPAALAEDVAAAAELDEVPHDEEVAGEPELLDDVELTVDRVPRPRPQRQVFVRGRALAVAAAPAFLHDAAQIRISLSCRPLTVGQGNGGSDRGDELEVERRRPADLSGEFDHAGIAGEAPLHLGARAQVGTGRCRQPGVELSEAAAGAHRGERGRELALGGRGVVGVRRGDDADAALQGELDERVVAGRVERVAVVPELDQHTVAAERLDHPIELAPGDRRAVLDERRRHESPCGSR